MTTDDRAVRCLCCGDIYDFKRTPSVYCSEGCRQMVRAGKSEKAKHYLYYVAYVRQIPNTDFPARFDYAVIAQSEPIATNRDIDHLHEILNEDHALEGALVTVLSFQLLSMTE